MLNIGNLDQVGILYTTSYIIRNDGQQTTSPTQDSTFYFRRSLRNSETKLEGDMVHGVNDIEIIVRFNTAFKMDSQISIYQYKNSSGTQFFYEITGIEEIGRAEGLKIRCTRIQSREE